MMSSANESNNQTPSGHVDISIDVNFPIAALTTNSPAGAVNGAAARNAANAPAAINNLQPAQDPPIFLVRERLFLTIMQRLTAVYERKVSPPARRVVEMLFLVSAIALLMTLMFIHVSFTRTQNTCFENITLDWMSDGVLHVEIIKNLHMLDYQDRWLQWYISERSKQRCHFAVRDVFLLGPQAIPVEVRQKKHTYGYAKLPTEKDKTERPPPEPPETPSKTHSSDDGHDSLLSLFFKAPSFPVANVNTNYEVEEETTEHQEPLLLTGLEAEAFNVFRDEFFKTFTEDDVYQTLYQAEFSLIFGVLRLPDHYREKHSIPMETIKIDADSTCFGDAWTRYSMRYFIGYEESVSASLRQLAVAHGAKHDHDGRRNLGYLHDLRTHEHYHFITLSMTKYSYLVAFAIMAVFTFAISMLLRFSHHQIFIIIYDFLHWFESNQPMHVPIAPLLTVILALVGMEAIMSEIFNDTSTAFYIILIVWVGDQFDAVCCRTPISKKFWLRFFYLYQYLFYAYQYRFGGQYSGLALLTSALFIMHSMIYFFHHYEMPYILHQERLQRIMSDVGSVPPMMGPVDIRAVSVRISGISERQNSTENPEENQPGNANNSRSEPIPELSGDAEPFTSRRETNQPENNEETPSPSQVFDARSPPVSRKHEPREQPPAAATAETVDLAAGDNENSSEEQLARSLVDDAMEELFNR